MSKDNEYNNLKINLSHNLTGVIATDGNNILDKIERLEYTYDSTKEQQTIVIKLKDNKETISKILDEDTVGRVEIDTRIIKENKEDIESIKENKKRKKY